MGWWCDALLVAAFAVDEYSLANGRNGELAAMLFQELRNLGWCDVVVDPNVAVVRRHNGRLYRLSGCFL